MQSKLPNRFRPALREFLEGTPLNFEMNTLSIGRLSMKRKKTLVSLLNEIVSLKEEDLDLDAGQEVPGALVRLGRHKPKN